MLRSGSTLLARASLVFALAGAPLARAVYAPLPDQGFGREWTVSLRTGATWDNNIFGSASGKIASWVCEVSPSVAYAGSLTEQTYAEFNYTLTLDRFDNRPGDRDLDSHQLTGRLAHQFTPGTTVDFTDVFAIARNPESLLAGITKNTNQSYKRNEVDVRATTTLGPKAGLVAKLREVHFAYDNDVLARAIDRDEVLYGFEGNYAILPELKAVGELRHEDIYYRIGGETKNKRTNFAMAGVDYAVAKKLSLTSRLGGEWRDRASEGSTSSPYAELSARYEYAQGSSISGGYTYTFEETSNVALYNDTHVNRFFVNVQHAITPLVVASGSLTFEPDTLEGRGTNPNRDEHVTRAGVALTWLPTPHWSLSVTADHDLVGSEDVSRHQERDRYGLNAGYTF